MPDASLPMKPGWNSTSGQRKRSLPGDDVTVWQLVGLFLVAALARRLHLCVEIQGDEAELLLHISDDFALSGRREGVATLSKNLHHVLGQVASGEIETENGMGKRVALVDWHSVRDAVTGIHDNSRRTARGMQREHSLNGDVHGR